MSEFQSYLFERTCECLTPEEVDAVGDLSSHIEVSGNRAYVDYQYGEFKHDPLVVLAEYFDSFRYFASWGQRRIAFRFDEDLVDLEALGQYQVGQVISVVKKGASVLIDINFSQEFDGWSECSENSWNPFARFHEQTLNRDYRWLHILWVQAQLEEEGEDATAALSLPEGMSLLQEEHKLLGEFFEIDPDLIEALQELAKNDDSGSPFDPDEWFDTLDVKQLREVARELMFSPKRARALLWQRLHTTYVEGMGLGKREKRAIRVREISQKAAEITGGR